MRGIAHPRANRVPQADSGSAGRDLAWAARHGVDRLRVRSDSLLLVKQVRGEFRVKHPGLQPLWEEARSLVRQIGEVQFEHVRRELNEDADRLANQAMDEAAASRP